MKPLDTNIVFDSFDEALAFVKKKECDALHSDPMRQNQPTIIAPHDRTRPPLKIFPNVAYWNTADEKDWDTCKLPWHNVT